MSNISKQPIKIEEGVNVLIENNKIVVKGPKGNLEARIPRGIRVVEEDGQIKVSKLDESTELEKFAGLARAIIANLVKGVSQGFKKQLELSGVGYRARVEGGELVLNVGFTNPVKIKPLEGITISAEENIITVAGFDKQAVGDTASEIRNVRPPDPYKGKGIKYVGEIIRRKVGKAAKAVGAAK